MCKDIISMKGLEITAVCINRGPVKEVPCALTVKYSAAFKSYVTTLKQYGKGKVFVAQSCPTLCDPMDCSPPDSSVHGILQTKILVQYNSSSMGSSWPKDQPRAILYITNWFVLSFTGCLFIHFSFNKYLLILTTTFSDTKIGIQRTVMSETD